MHRTRTHVLLPCLVLLLVAGACGTGKRVRWEVEVDDDKRSSDAGSGAETPGKVPDNSGAGNAATPSIPASEPSPTDDAALDPESARAALSKWLAANTGPAGARATVLVAATESSAKRVLLKFDLASEGNEVGTARMALRPGGGYEVESLHDDAAQTWIDPTAWLLDFHSKRSRRTMGDMRTVGTAVESYSIDNNFYPPASSIAALAAVLEPTYVRQLPERDGWGGNLVYWGAASGADYCILSAGGDGVLERPLEAYRDGAYSATDTELSRAEAATRDLVFCTGSFVQYR